MVDFFPIPMLLGVGILILLLVQLRGKRSRSYQWILVVFWVYLLEAVSQVLYPIPRDISTGTRESTAAILARINLVPFNFGSLFESSPSIIWQQLFGNLLLTLPFGFIFPLLVHVTTKRMLWLALVVGLSTETAQLAVSLLIGAGYHSVDINDTLLNAAGVLVGYGLYRGCIWLRPKFKG